MGIVMNKSVTGIIFIAAMFSLAGLAQGQSAGQIIADPETGKSRPLVDQTANGLPLVQITTPNATGLSHNQYRSFNVDNKGVILNNSSEVSNTQLGGYVTGNPYMAEGGARIILNEVTGAGRSHLTGYTEVAGRSAEVIIANPNGISCSACGFINTTRGVLSTGVPLFGGDGSLDAFRVSRGDILLGSGGLNSKNTDQVDLIARSVKLNDQLWANQLNVLAGENQVDYAGLGITLINGGGTWPVVGIDVAELGGMYAGKIMLVGTGQGVGVSNAGDIASFTGDISVDSQGKVSLTGQTGAAGQLRIHSGDVIHNAGALRSKQDMMLSSAGGTSNSGSMAAQGDLHVSAGGDVGNAGSIESGQHLQLRAKNVMNESGALINGGSGTVFISAENHVGNTGRIYGDDIAIAARKLTNSVDSVSGKAGVIAARGKVNVGALSTFNLEGAFISGGGEVVIGRGLNSDYNAEGIADQILNQSARIESGGAMQLMSSDTDNANNHFSTEERITSVDDINELQLDHHPQSWDENLVRYGTCDPDNFDCLFMPDGSFGQNFTKYLINRTIKKTFITSSEPGEILVGGNLIIRGNARNTNSRIVVGGRLTGAPDRLINNETTGAETTLDRVNASHYITRFHGHLFGRSREMHGNQSFVRPPVIKESAMAILPGNAMYSGQLASDVGASLNTHLFQLRTQPDQAYLIETDPRFTNYASFLSSDYLLARLSLNPQQLQKRLGDGYYEQQQINQQLLQLTGKRFISSYTNNEEQYQALMDAGVASMDKLGLVYGVELTQAQMMALDTDIVWLVMQQVTLPDGSSTAVLAPVVYLAHSGRDALVQGVAAVPYYGALISAKAINLSIAGAMENSATVLADDAITVHAGDIKNTGVVRTLVPDAYTELFAKVDVMNTGGTIDGQRVVIRAGRDIVADTSISRGVGENGNADHGHNASHVVINNESRVDADDLVMQSGRDINLTAANVTVTENALLSAGRDMNLNALNTANNLDVNYDAQNHLRQGETHVNGTQIKSDGQLSLVAGQDINSVAAYAHATGNLTVTAGRDLALKSGLQQHSYDQEIKHSSSSLLSSSESHTKNVQQQGITVGSTLSGNTVLLDAGRNTLIDGSNVVGTEQVGIVAANNVALRAAENTHTAQFSQRDTTSGVFSGGGIGITLGSEEQLMTGASQRLSQRPAIVGSIDGSVIIKSENTYSQIGSNVVAPGGNITIVSGKADITAATAQSVIRQGSQSQQSGLSLTLSSPVVSVVQTAEAMYRASEQSGDARMQGLATLAPSLAAYDAAVDLSKNADDMTKAELINMSISLGDSKRQQQVTQRSSVVKGSQVAAGGDVTIITAGANKASTITVQGSDISAGNNAVLNAEASINLLADSNTAEQHSVNSAMNSSVGIGFSLGGTQNGLTLTAGIAGSRGHADGFEATVSNAYVAGEKQLTLISGDDINMIGAVASATQIRADIGGNLNIESLQDLAVDDSQQKSAGASVSICVSPFCAGTDTVSGHVNNAGSEGNYASVTEQAGIKAGDGGVLVTVKRHTDLKGGLISDSVVSGISGEPGVVSAMPSQFITGTLTYSDIQNKSAAHVDGIGINLSSDMATQGKYGAIKAVAGTVLATGNASGSSSGLTRSAVNAIEIGIVDAHKQQLTGDAIADMLARLNLDNDVVHVSAKKQDVAGMQKKLQAKLAIQKALFSEAVKFTDESYRALFVESADMYLVRKDAKGQVFIQDKLSEQEKLQLQPAADGNVYVATNGIFNTPQDAAYYADQHRAANVDGPLYIVVAPDADNAISELMVSGYQLHLSGDTLGLANAERETKNVLQLYGKHGLHLDGHSRGSITIANALESLRKQENSTGSLSATSISLYGPAYNSAKADGILRDLQKRDAMTDREKKVAAVLKFQNHRADLIGRFIGGNPSSGGTIPAGSSVLAEAFKVLFGDNTAHNCYGHGGAACQVFWNNDPGKQPVLRPVPQPVAP